MDMARKLKYRVFSSLDGKYWEVRKADTNLLVFRTKSLVRAVCKAKSLHRRKKNGNNG